MSGAARGARRRWGERWSDLMHASLTVCKLFGIPIKVHVSWPLVFMLITWMLSTIYFPSAYPGSGWPVYWAAGGMTSVLFFASVLIHELLHSVTAQGEGVPVKGITLFIFGGVSEIGAEPSSAGAEWRIAIAGPMSSLVLAAVFGLLGLRAPNLPFVIIPALYLAWINLAVAVFNMVPGFPMDGGRVLRATLWRLSGSLYKATRWATMVGQVIGLLLVLGGVVFIFLGNFLDGLWIGLVGWFLTRAASSSYQQTKLHHLLAAIRARDVMSMECQIVPADMRLDQLMNQFILGAGWRCCAVSAGNGDLQGLITLHDVVAVPREQWHERTAGQALKPLEALLQARPDEDVLSLLHRMDDADANQVPVVEGGHVVGMITRERLFNYIQARSELGA